MPELAEVEYFRRQWSPGLGEKIERVLVHEGARVYRGTDVPGLVRGLTGSVLRESFCHGKQMIFASPAGWLGVHLGMTGELRVEAPDFTPARHDHLVLVQKERALVFADFRLFGRLRFDPGAEAPAWWRELPPALLSAEFTPALIDAWLARRARSPLKAVLLDQEAFPGVGNWMADEILWRLCLHPATPAGSLTPALRQALRKETRFVARTAMETVGVKWGDLPETWLYLHRWDAGSLCPRPACHTPLVRETLAGRTTCWCPACQPGEATGGKPVRTGHRREKPVKE